MKPIRFHPKARDEALSAIAYYQNLRQDLGDDLQLELENSLAAIAARPSSFPSHGATSRKCLLKRFPYTIHFRELDAEIWIGAVAHQKKRPEYWRRRSIDDLT